MKLLDKEKQVKILFEDNHLIIVNKPSPLLTQPTEKEEDSLEMRLKSYIKEKEKKQNNVFLHCIHRIDKKVSGIVIFAKSSKALKRMQRMQKMQQIEKKYIAILNGELSVLKDNLKNYLKRSSFKTLITNKNDEDAKLAVLDYQVIKHINRNSLVEITLRTGRYHQIRAQFAHIGHPIMGDKKYGSPQNFESLMLHHKLVSFVHPVTLEQITISSTADFVEN